MRTGLDAVGSPGLDPLPDDLFARGPWERCPLVTDPRPAAGLVRLAILDAASARGWTPLLREPLRALRCHTDPDVGLAAWQVHTARE